MQPLIEVNVRWLEQVLSLVERLDDHSFAAAPPGLAPHRAGAHLRHILDFYWCLLDGLASSRIDYDARLRNEAVERNRKAAAARIRSVIGGLRSLPAHYCGREIWVRMEDAPEDAPGGGFLKSSVSRELQVLSSHTVHHFALIAMTLRLHGVEIDPDFGVAPSTLRYLASRAAEAA